MRIVGESEELVDALNAVLLPPRFTALWHKDSRDLEIIWGPVAKTDVLRSRAFDFRFNDEIVHCEFGDVSERLMLIADAARFLEPPSATGHRNLQAFEIYRYMAEQHPDSAMATSTMLTSFWIRSIDWDENRVTELARNLNFYMHYFDKESALVEIHENLPVETEEEQLERYRHGSFPLQIVGRNLDPFLLGLWENSVRSSIRLRFLYCYQILEYAAFYYIKEGTLRTIKRIVAAPNASMYMDDAVRQIADAMSEERMNDEAKIAYLVQQLVDPDLLWKEVEPNLSSLCWDSEFDGGFRIPALVRASCDSDEFRSAWHPKFIDSVRKIRNALVHGRESRMSGVISPTKRNDDLLRPWLAPLSATALQAILYWDV